MQEPAPLSIGRVLHTAGVQLLQRNERPALRVALHVQELVYEFRRMQVVHIAALMQARTLQANRSRMIFRIRLSCRTYGVLLHGGVLQVLGCLGEEVELVPELNEVFLLADGTGSFTARYLRATRKGVAAGALAGKLLKGREVLDHQPLSCAAIGRQPRCCSKYRTRLRYSLSPAWTCFLCVAKSSS